MASIDFNLHKIFVEGDTDRDCLKKVLELKYGILFPCNGINIKDAIVSCEGWSKLKKQPMLIDEIRITNGGKNLVIFDADGKSNHGGYQKRYTHLIDMANDLNVKFEIFSKSKHRKIHIYCNT